MNSNTHIQYKTNSNGFLGINHVTGGHRPVGKQSSMNGKRVVHAEDIVKELTGTRRETNNPMYALRRAIKAAQKTAPIGEQTDEPVFRLRDAQIQGKFDLKHRVVDVAIDIKNCEFQGEVDFRHCEFKQVVDLSGCVFQGKLTSGSGVEAHTIYRKDLICDGVHFNGDVSFVGARAEGDAHFSIPVLEDVNHRTTTFRKKVDFSGFKCEGYGFFKGARFESKNEKVDFSHAFFGRNLHLDKAVFRGVGNFESLRCGDGAFFRRARFESEHQTLGGFAVSFADASFGGRLDYGGAVFKGPASFHPIKCDGDVSYVNTRFESKKQGPDGFAVDFATSSFSRQLVCKHAVFKGPVSLNAIRCNSNGSFENAEFESGVLDLRYASFEGSLSCENATFSGQECSLRYLNVGGNLILRYAYFDSRVTLAHANIARKLSLGGSHFENRVGLYNTAIRMLELINDHATRIRAVFRGEQLEDFMNLKTDARWQKYELWTKFTRIMKYYDNRAELLYIRHYIDRGELLYRDSNGEYQAKPFTKENPKQAEDTILEVVSRDRAGLRGIAFEYNKEYVLGEDDEVNQQQADKTFRELRRAIEDVLKDEKRPERKIRATYRKLVKRRDEERKDKKQSKIVRAIRRSLQSVLENLFEFFCTTKSAREVLLKAFLPFKNGGLNLSNCTFKTFHGGPIKRLKTELALGLVEGQDPDSFSRDPYVQLENFYKNHGNDAEARNVYYKGRRDYREAASEGHGGPEWSVGTNILDWLWKWVTRYGISLKRLLGIACFFLVIGTLVFLPDEALVKAKTSTAQTPLGETEIQATSDGNQDANGKEQCPPSETDTQASSDGNQDANGKEQCPPRWQYGLGYRAAYSVDQFLPLVNLQVDSKWEPNGAWLQAYATLHAVVGWLIVPLLVAALAGIIRR